MIRFSVNKLAQYLTCPSAARRRRIIADQKAPKPPIAARYGLAEDPAANFFLSGGDPAVLDDAVRRLRTDRAGSDWAIDRRRCTADALEELAKLAPRLPFDEVTYVSAPERPPTMRVKGVEISVRPDVLLHFQRRGADCIGAVKLTCPPATVPGQWNRIRATERKRDAQEQVHGRADHRIHPAG